MTMLADTASTLTSSNNESRSLEDTSINSSSSTNSYECVKVLGMMCEVKEGYIIVHNQPPSFSHCHWAALNSFLN